MVNKNTSFSLRKLMNGLDVYFEEEYWGSFAEFEYGDSIVALEYPIFKITANDIVFYGSEFVWYEKYDGIWEADCCGAWLWLEKDGWEDMLYYETDCIDISLYNFCTAVGIDIDNVNIEVEDIGCEE